MTSFDLRLNDIHLLLIFLLFMLCIVSGYSRSFSFREIWFDSLLGRRLEKFGREFDLLLVGHIFLRFNFIINGLSNEIVRSGEMGMYTPNYSTHRAQQILLGLLRLDYPYPIPKPMTDGT